MTPQELERINELAHKKKTVGLTDEEKKEQQALREAYLGEWRQGVMQVLDHTYIQTPDGKKRKLQVKEEQKDV